MRWFCTSTIKYLHVLSLLADPFDEKPEGSRRQTSASGPATDQVSKPAAANQRHPCLRSELQSWHRDHPCCASPQDRNWSPASSWTRCYVSMCLGTSMIYVLASSCIGKCESFNGIYYTCTFLGKDSWLHVRFKAHMREEHLKSTWNLRNLLSTQL